MLRIVTFILLLSLTSCDGPLNHQTQMHDFPIVDPNNPSTFEAWEKSDYNHDNSKLVAQELLYLHGKLGDGTPKTKTAVAIEICETLHDGITEPQSSALQFLVQNEGSIFLKVRDAIYQQYEESYPAYKTGMEMAAKMWGGAEEIEKMLPEIESGNEIDELVTINSISVHPPNGNDVAIGIEFLVEWDEEHGMGLRLLNGEILAIGTAHESFPTPERDGE